MYSSNHIVQNEITCFDPCLHSSFNRYLGISNVFYGSMVQSLKSSETFFSFFFIKYFKVLNLGGY